MKEQKWMFDSSFLSSLIFFLGGWLKCVGSSLTVHYVMIFQQGNWWGGGRGGITATVSWAFLVWMLQKLLKGIFSGNKQYSDFVWRRYNVFQAYLLLCPWAARGFASGKSSDFLFASRLHCSSATGWGCSMLIPNIPSLGSSLNVFYPVLVL